MNVTALGRENDVQKTRIIQQIHTVAAQNRGRSRRDFSLNAHAAMAESFYISICRKKYKKNFIFT